MAGRVDCIAEWNGQLSVIDFKSSTREKSEDNILNYFGKGEPLNKLSLDILSRINDENMLDNKISKVFSNMTADYPKTSEFVSPKEDPYYITYIELIKKYNPKIWPKFLTMLYNTSEEIKSIINKKGV